MAAARLTRLMILAAALQGLGACRDARSAPMRFYYPSTLSDIESDIGARLEKDGLFKKRGIQATTEGVPIFHPPPRPWNEYDLIIGGQAFAAILLSKGYQGKVVATLGSGGELCVIAPKSLAARRAADLKGKRVRTTMGNALHLYLLNWLRQEGVDPAEVQIVPYGKDSLSAEALLQDRRPEAFVSWSPLTELLISKGGWHRIAGPRGEYYITVTMSERLLNRPKEAQAALLALLDATSQRLRRPKDIDLSPDREPFKSSYQDTLRLRNEDYLADMIDPEPIRQAQKLWRSEPH